MVASGLSLWVPGKVRGQGRPRAVRRGPRVGVHKDAKDENYEAFIAQVWAANGQVRLDGPTFVEITAYLERPAGHVLKTGLLSTAGRRSPYPVKKPDIDNIQKSVFDALNTRAWADDSQIIRVDCRKEWADSITGPGLEIDAYVLDL